MARCFLQSPQQETALRAPQDRFKLKFQPFRDDPAEPQAVRAKADKEASLAPKFERPYRVSVSAFKQD